MLIARHKPQPGEYSFDHLRDLGQNNRSVNESEAISPVKQGICLNLVDGEDSLTTGPGRSADGDLSSALNQKGVEICGRPLIVVLEIQYAERWSDQTLCTVAY